MGRPKGSQNNKHSISYPRTCVECGYVSNNPAMYSYHKKTHDPIPYGTKCHMGCGKNAKHKNTNGKYTCNKNFWDCTEYIKNVSIRVKNDWDGNSARKEKTKKIFEDLVVYNEDARKKCVNAIKDNAIIYPSDAKDYRSYARKCRSIAQKWAKENGHTLGVKGNHVDHKLSLSHCYNLGLSVDIASHPANLRIVGYRENVAKGPRSLISVERLLEEIKKFNSI